MGLVNLDAIGAANRHQWRAAVGFHPRRRRNRLVRGFPIVAPT